MTGGGRPQRLSLADTSDRQGTASADRFIKWHFLQLGLQKMRAGLCQSSKSTGAPLACRFIPKLCCYDKFFDLGCLKSAFFLKSSLAPLLLTAGPLACTLSQQLNVHFTWVTRNNQSLYITLSTIYLQYYSCLMSPPTSQNTIFSYLLLTNIRFRASIHDFV